MRERVVVLGAGFAGLAVVRGLADEDVDIVLVDANNFHTFQPLLYQVATAGLDADDVSYPVRGIVRRQGNVTTRMARVTTIDLDARTVTLDPPGVDGPIGFDTLVVAAGTVTDDFGVPGVAEHSFGVKRLDDALGLRAHLLDRFERAAADRRLVDDGGIDVVVCGGGSTGVEMAGALRELYSKVLARDFPALPVRTARIVLVEMADRLLGPYTEASAAKALETLRRRNVEVRLGVGIERVEANRVLLTDGTVVHAHTSVWAAGVRAAPVAETLGTPLAKGGRVVVGPDLTIEGHPDVFAIGDIAAVVGRDGEPLPQVAQPAIQGGRHVARQIARRRRGLPRQPFAYRDKGKMATIGRNAAVTELANGMRFSGLLGWLAWLGLHLVYLLGFRNRINVFVNWCWNYVTYDRAARLLRESERT